MASSLREELLRMRLAKMPQKRFRGGLRLWQQLKWDQLPSTARRAFGESGFEGFVQENEEELMKGYLKELERVIFEGDDR